ncbi:DNRLRE domain-containing protein [Streptomyces sp. CB03238]|uniref:golvesin C-terminal-like domain-containing protein n=1 Tax=Streptomyces sp. CB03238 TaxID=1907777 RepID=UPI000A110196|nr:DNRLRE domain-containing protein [Streptomyces sp. CB03238]ORT59515.1 sugar-binding protein [Streptomyces sp. CB03238]
MRRNGRIAKGIDVKIPYRRYVSCLVAAAVAGTLLPQLAYAAPPGAPGDGDDKGVVDTIAGWFSDDEEQSAAAPPEGGKLEIPSREKLPRGQALPEPKRVKELTERRTSQARFWQLSDGRVQAELSAVPTSYRSGSSWKTIDPAVKPTAQGFANTTNSARSSFVTSPDKLLRYEAPDGRSVTLGLHGAKAALKPEAKGATVTYKGAVPGADLEYVVGAGQVKENIVLAERPAGPVKFTFTLDTEGLTPEVRKDGSIALFGEAPQTPVMVIPAPYMTDAKKDTLSPTGGTYSTQVTQKLTRAKNGKGWTLTVTPDASWLAAKERQYPVVIDPTITVTPNASQSQDAMVLSDQPGVNFNTTWKLSAGKTDTGTARSLIKFPIDEIPAGVDIDTARLEMYFDQAHTTNGNDVTIGAYRATGSWAESTATWSNTSTLVGELSGTSVQQDDGDAGTAAVGEWPKGSTSAAISGDYAYNKNTATGETYTWQPKVPETASYRVDVHYPAASDAATAAPYTVTHRDGTNSYTVNQTGTGATWKTLDSTQRWFSKGTAGKVVLGDTGSATTRTLADAVRLVNPATIVKNKGEYNQWHKFPVADTVQKWVSGTATNHGFVLKATDESSTALTGGPRYEAADGNDYGGETSTYPRLTVTYGKVGAALNSPTVVHSTGPELSWAKYSNTTGDSGLDIVEYQLHRSTQQVFTPSAATLIAPIPASATTYTDTTAVPTPDSSTAEIGKSYYYQLAVKTKGGELLGSPTRVVGIPKAGRTMKIIQAGQTDTTLSSAQPTTNQDKIKSWDIGQTWLSVGNNSSTYGKTRAVLKFPTSDIPTTATVLENTFYMWGAETTSETNGAVYELHSLTRDFDETTATWNNANATTAWTTPGGDMSATVADTVPQITDEVGRHWWDATGLMKSWVKTPASNKGVAVRLKDESTTGPQERTLFLSAEAADPQLRPYMRVIYVDATTEDTYYAPTTPARMTPNSTYTVDFTVTNTTATAWAAGERELSYTWKLPDGTDVTTGGNQLKTAIPALLPGKSATIQAQVNTAINSDSGNKRREYVLGWDVRKVADGTWLSAGTGGIPPLKQNVAIEDPTSNQLGLEKFYSYSGKNTGAGSSLMNNVAAGNSVWQYNAINNPGRGLNTFARLAYNTLDTSDTVLGHGWSAQVSGPTRLGAPLDFHPNTNPTEIRLPDGDGTTHTFRKQADGSWLAPAGVHFKVTPKANLDCKPTKDPVPDAWTLTRPDGTRFLFGCDGYMTSAVDNDGNTQTFTYEERRSKNKPTKFLAYITDPAGRQTLTLDYYKKGDASYQYINDTGAKVSGTSLNDPDIYDHVKSMTDISGRKISFYYTDTGLLGQVVDGEASSQPKVFAFTYDATQGMKNVKLVKATDPRGNATSLAYYYPKEGDDPKYHWWTQTITDRLGGATNFAYKPNTANPKFIDTKVTDAELRATDHVLDDFGRPVQMTNAKAQTSKMSWDADNNVVYMEEANGAKTAYCYDAKTGYPLRQWDAEVTKSWTQFNPTDYCNPASYPDKATKFEYTTRLDGYSADLWRKTSPLGNTWEFGYDQFGNQTSVTDPEGVATTTAGDYTAATEYDGYGQPTKQTDANGHATLYADFGPAGYPKKITDALNNVTTFVYDERGNTTEVVNAKGAKVTQTYDYFGRPLEQKQPKDQAAGVFITTPAPVYDANNNMVKVFSPNGAESSSVYDAADQVTATLAPKDLDTDDERRTTTTYDKVGNVKTVTEPKGNLTATVGDYTTTYTYDEIYQPVSVVNAKGDKVSSQYDNVGNLVTVVDPKKNATADTADYTTKYVYDLNHRVTKTIDAAGTFTTVNYDLDGRVDKSTDAEGNTTEMVFDRRGLTKEVKVPYSKDGSGNITYRTTRLEYDEVGNKTKEISPRGVETTDDATDYTSETIYDELNRVKEQLRPFDKDDTRYNTPDKTLFFYDAVGQLQRVSAPPSQGQTVRNDTHYTYYDNGWTKSAQDPFDITTTYDYNNLGQQTKNTLTSAGGSSQRTMTWDFYPSGNQKARSDDGIPVGSQVVVVDSSDVHNTASQGTWSTSTATGQWGYDTRTAPKGLGLSSFTWQLTIPQDGSYEVFVRHGDVTGAATNAPYQITHASGSVTKPVNQTQRKGEWVSLGSYSFTESGTQKITLTDAADGTVVADGVKLVRSNAGDVDNEKKDFTYRYDVNGLLSEVKDLSPGAKADAYTMTYDELNQLSKVEEKLGSTVKNTTALTYDANGNPVTTTHDVTWSKSEYDVRDMINKITNADSPTAGNQQITTFTYTDRGQPLKQVKPNGNTVDYGYWLNGAVKSQVEKKSGGTVVASHDLEYDPNGNRSKDTAKVMNADNPADYLDTVSTFAYDPQDRIAKVTKTGDAAGTEEYVYDGNSNIVEQTMGTAKTLSTYDRNRLLKTTTGGVSATYNYDPLGRLDTVSSNGSVQEKYAYDGFDRIAKHTAGTGTSAKSTTYVYDAFDRTASQTTSGTSGKTTLFTYLGMESKVLREEVAGKATKSYQYSPWGQKLTQIKHNTDATKEYSQYLYHPKGDVEAVTKDDGNTRATYGYTAYGSDDEKQFTGADKPDAANPDKEQYNNYRYNAHRYDDGSGTYDMGFRNYDPGLNRFLTRDMYGGALDDMSLATDPYTGNRYAFAGGNPISFVEIDGHFFDDISFSDIGHAALDVAGMVPVIGEVADVANGVWYAAEGNYEDAALSMAAAIPGVGAAATAAKWAKKGAKAADAVKGSNKAAKAKPKAKAGDKPKSKSKPKDGGKGKHRASSQKGKKAEADGGSCPIPQQEPVPNSFVPGTKIVMADGSAKNIEDLKIGEMVLASDPETGELQARPVVDTIIGDGVKHLVTLTVDTDGKNGKAKPAKITATDGHPFWLPDFGRWAEAGELEPGMWLQTSAGTWVQITTVSDTYRTQRVHNLTVAGQHTYHVQAGEADLLVHNASKKKRPSKCEFTQKVRQEIVDGNLVENDGYLMCDYCGDPVDIANPSRTGVKPPHFQMELDHWQPVAMGGTREASNGRVACRDCNQLKSDMGPLQFLLLLNGGIPG